MNFRKLRIFYKTAINLNMTKVAKEMYISQPSISQSINELENELGVKLFDRIGKKLYLTHEGELFLNYTRRILNIYDEATKTIKDFRDNNKGKIKIGASSTIGTYILPEIIKEFSSEYKDIEILLIIDNTEHIEKLIIENKIDFAYVEGKVNSEEIISEVIWQDELVFICGNEHRFKDMDIISGEEIAKEKLIMREKGSGSREHVERYLNNKNIEYKIFLELGSTEAIMRTVGVNLGIGCVSVRSIEDKIMLGNLYSFRLSDGILTRDLMFIAHKDKFISKNMKLFTEFTKKNTYK